MAKLQKNTLSRDTKRTCQGRKVIFYFALAITCQKKKYVPEFLILVLILKEVAKRERMLINIPFPEI